jgi:hypothetical protein
MCTIAATVFPGTAFHDAAPIRTPPSVSSGRFAARVGRLRR